MSLYKISSIKLSHDRRHSESKNKLLELLNQWLPGGRLPEADIYVSPELDIDDEKLFFSITTDLLRTYQVNVINRRNIGFKALVLIPAKVRHIYHKN